MAFLNDLFFEDESRDILEPLFGRTEEEARKVQFTSVSR